MADQQMNREIREEFWQAFAKSPYIMIRLDGSNEHAEPMTAQLDKDARHTIWFFTGRDNRIAPGGQAMAQFMAKDHDVFACLAGRLVEETDPATFDRHWSNVAEAWFPGGRNDPNVLMLRYEISSAEVWLQDVSLKGKFKMLTGSTVKPSETGSHATGNV